MLDPRTRLILFKLLNKNFVSVIDGCLSTGKEVGSQCVHAYERETLMAYIFGQRG